MVARGVQDAASGEVRGTRPLSRTRSRRGMSARGMWLLVLPAAVAYLTFLIYPALRSAVEAFTNWSGILPEQKFIGFANFWAAIHDPVVLTAVRNVVIIAIVVTIVQNGLGLVAALALRTSIKTRFILRSILFLPVLVNPLVIAYIWQFIFVYGGPWTASF